eukprot:5736-Eustigmatos_ZCMA.PRE.1
MEMWWDTGLLDELLDWSLKEAADVHYFLGGRGIPPLIFPLLLYNHIYDQVIYNVRKNYVKTNPSTFFRCRAIDTRWFGKTDIVNGKPWYQWEGPSWKAHG